MSDDLPIELAGLPYPGIVDELSYTNARAAFLVRLKADFEAAGIDYDVTGLEANPGVILMENAAYHDTVLRQRINEAVRANLLPFAVGADLDILAQFYDVARLNTETDTALRLRVVLAIRGRSTGGTEPRYRGVALSADVRVADAAVYTVGRDPTVHVAVFSTDNGGVADAALLAAVNAALQAPDVRMVNDVIVVASAAQVTSDIIANVWLLPQASETAIADAEASLRAAWPVEMTLGRDLSLSWLYSKLQVGGIHHVEVVTPAVSVVAPFNQALALGAVTLTNMGRDF